MANVQAKASLRCRTSAIARESSTQCNNQIKLIKEFQSLILKKESLLSELRTSVKAVGVTTKN